MSDRPKAPCAGLGAARRAGRPATKMFSQMRILHHGLQLAKQLPLQEISVGEVSRSLNIAAALTYYYVGSRDALTSGIMNLFYRDLQLRWPEETGNWRYDLQVTAECVFKHLIVYPGIARYVALPLQFRIYQAVQPGEVDFGANMLEHLTCRVRAAGLSSDETSYYVHHILSMVIGAANSGDFTVADNTQRDDADQIHCKELGCASHAQSDMASIFQHGLAVIMSGLDRDVAQAQNCISNRTSPPFAAAHLS